jgi:hypothetical protein
VFISTLNKMLSSRMDETMINPTISPLGSISPHAIFSSSPPSQPNRHHLVRRMYSDQQPLSASIPLPKSHIHRTHSELQLAVDVQRAERVDFRMCVRLVVGMQSQCITSGYVHPLTEQSMQDILRTKAADEHELEGNSSSEEYPEDDDFVFSLEL